MKQNRQDFEALVRGCTDDLYRFAYWLAKDSAVAEDLVQETLLRAWRAMDQLHDAAKVRAWLITTLRREFARLHERVAPSEMLSLDQVEDVLSMPEPVDGVLEHSELLRRVLELPRDQREALVLQIVFGYSQNEIAALLEITPSAVNNRLFRARRQLVSPSPAVPQRKSS